MNSALVGAIVVGGIALVLGFFGPLIVTPKSNLGPLLGIFTTGPLGFAIGAVVGVVVGFIRVQFGKS